MTPSSPVRRRLLGTFASVCTANAIGPIPTALASDFTARGTDRAPSTGRLDALADEARRIERLHSIVVMHAGEVLLAEAFRGPPTDQPVNVKSVSKSLVAALLGCALERGVVSDLDTTLATTIAGVLPDGLDPRAASLTLENLVSMRAGLARTSGSGYARWVTSGNWLRYALTRPFIDEPGGAMLYSTGNFHVLGIVLASLTGARLHTLARRWLGEPLDIEFPPWTRDPQGYDLGGNEMSLSPLAMARFGELYRRNGHWEGERLFPGHWVKESFTARSISPWSGDGYGYGWFLRAMGDTLAAYARGYGGQMIHVLPTEDLVVAMTSDTTRPARGDGYIERLHGLIETHLLST